MRWPYLNQKVIQRNARLHRLKRKGLTPPADKAAARVMCAEAAASHPITSLPARSQRHNMPRRKPQTSLV